MAAGDVKNNIQTVTSGSSLNIQAGSGQEWSIHNIYYGGAVDLYVTDGVTSLRFDQDTAAGARLGAIFHCTNLQYVKVTNTSGSSFVIAYDGIQTK